VTKNYKEGLYTKEQYDQAVQFYDSQLHEITLPDCRKAAQILTADPRKIGPLPVPRYPNDPQAKAEQARNAAGQKG
jgi:hypothetical protein